MTGTFSSTALAWLLTYAIHSTLLLLLAWALVRVRRWSPGASELLWKSAMLGGILTASFQMWLDVRPAGTVMLQPAALTAATSVSPSDQIERIDQSRSSAPVQATDIAPAPQSLPAQSGPRIAMTKAGVATLVWA